MIQTRMEYELTSVWVAKFRAALEEHQISERPAHIEEEVWMAFAEALSSQILTLERDLEEWESRHREGR